MATDDTVYILVSGGGQEGYQGLHGAYLTLDEAKQAMIGTTDCHIQSLVVRKPARTPDGHYVYGREES